LKKSERIGKVSQTSKKKKDEKNCEDQFNTPSYTSMYLYDSVNTLSYTTSTTNMCHKDFTDLGRRPLLGFFGGGGQRI
jgi:hypothetical protein